MERKPSPLVTRSAATVIVVWLRDFVGYPADPDSGTSRLPTAHTSVGETADTEYRIEASSLGSAGRGAQRLRGHRP